MNHDWIFQDSSLKLAHTLGLDHLKSSINHNCLRSIVLTHILICTIGIRIVIFGLQPSLRCIQKSSARITLFATMWIMIAIHDLGYRKYCKWISFDGMLGFQSAHCRNSPAWMAHTLIDRHAKFDALSPIKMLWDVIRQGNVLRDLAETGRICVVTPTNMIVILLFMNIFADKRGKLFFC